MNMEREISETNWNCKFVEWKKVYYRSFKFILINYVLIKITEKTTMLLDLCG